MKFTTSWDDGHPLDLRVASLLSARGMTGTVYVARRHEHLDREMTPEELRELATTMEIGAHTLTHDNLPGRTEEQIYREIAGSKQWLEDTLETECCAFAYPRGRYDAQTKEIVQKVGFRCARTAEIFAFKGDDPFAMGSSVHVYPYPLRPVLHSRCLDPLRRSWRQLRHMGIAPWAHTSWLSMAKAVFDAAYAKDAVWFHLRGHSWEVEAYGLRAQLEAFLDHVTTKPKVTHVTNTGILS